MVQQLALLDPIFKNLLGNDSNPKTFSECFSLLVEAIETKLSFTAIVFIVEDIDLFAKQPKQSVLYSLFDLVHVSRNRPIIVIGCTSRSVRFLISKLVEFFRATGKKSSVEIQSSIDFPS